MKMKMKMLRLRRIMLEDQWSVINLFMFVFLNDRATGILISLGSPDFFPPLTHSPSSTSTITPPTTATANYFYSS